METSPEVANAYGLRLGSLESQEGNCDYTENFRPCKQSGTDIISSLRRMSRSSGGNSPSKVMEQVGKKSL